jgi:hypothetical protein
MKRIPLIVLVLVFALISFGCSGAKNRPVSQDTIVMYYNTLNSRYIEIVDFYEALENKKVTKFNWRIMADSSIKSSQRVIDLLEGSDHPMAPKLIDIANAQIDFTKHMEQHVDHGAEIDWSYKDKVQTQLEELKPEIDRMMEELLERD